MLRDTTYSYYIDSEEMRNYVSSQIITLPPVPPEIVEKVALQEISDNLDISG